MSGNLEPGKESGSILKAGAWRVLRNVASVARNGLRVLGAPVNPTSLVASAEEHLRGSGQRAEGVVVWGGCLVSGN